MRTVLILVQLLLIRFVAPMTCDGDVAIVVLVDHATRLHLRAAQCSYLRDANPACVVYVLEYADIQNEKVQSLRPELSDNGTASRKEARRNCADMVQQVTIPFSSNLHHVFEKLSSQFRTLLVDGAKWVLVVKPWTLVNLPKLVAYVESLNEQDLHAPPEASIPWTSPVAAVAAEAHIVRAKAKTVSGTRHHVDGDERTTHSASRLVSDPSNSANRLWSEGRQLPVLIGRVRNSTTELAYLGSPPHCGYEFGLLLRSAALMQVGWSRRHHLEAFLSRSVAGNDFHPLDAAVADLTSVLLHPPLGLLPTARHDLFLSLPPARAHDGMRERSGAQLREKEEEELAMGLNEQSYESKDGAIESAVAMGPLDPYPMMRLARRLGFGCLHADSILEDSRCSSNSDLWSAEQLPPPPPLPSSSSPWQQSPPPLSLKASFADPLYETRPSSSKVLIAVLARENELGNVIEGTLSTWGSSLLTSASILFIVSHTAMHGLGFKKRKDKFMDFDDTKPEMKRIKRLLRSESEAYSPPQRFHGDEASTPEEKREQRRRLAQQGTTSSPKPFKIHRVRRLPDGSVVLIGSGHHKSKTVSMDELEYRTQSLTKAQRSKKFEEIRRKVRNYRKQTKLSLYNESTQGRTRQVLQMPQDETKVVRSEWYTLYRRFLIDNPKIVAPSDRLRTERDVHIGDNLAGPKSKRQVRVVSLWLNRSMPDLDENRGDTRDAEHPLSSNSTQSAFYGSSMAKPMAWSLWLRAKVAKVVQLFTEYNTDSEVRQNSEIPHSSKSKKKKMLDMDNYHWFVIVDDDTYVRVPSLVHRVLPLHLEPSRWADPQTFRDYGSTSTTSRRNASRAMMDAVAVGRRFTCEKKDMALLGGGPGIFMSRGAIAAMRRAECAHLKLPIISGQVPGGDGWLGQCFDISGVQLSHEWRMKSLPPFAYETIIAEHAVSFHKSNVRTVHGYLRSKQTEYDSKSLVLTSTGKREPPTLVYDEMGFHGARLRRRFASYYLSLSSSAPLFSCHPVHLRDQGKLNCLPFFTVIGAQKGGTTSLFSWLSQHPFVQVPKEKELNFYGNIWPIGFRRNRRVQPLSAFTFAYLKKFPLIDFMPSDKNSNAINRSDVFDLIVLPSNHNIEEKASSKAAMTDFLHAFSALTIMEQEKILERLEKKVEKITHQIYGEASPDYLVSPTALANMLRYAPSMKIIVSLRDPVERAISAYYNKLADGTIHRHMLRLLYKTQGIFVDKRSDDEVLESTRLLHILNKSSEATCIGDSEHEPNYRTAVDKEKLLPCVPTLIDVIEQMNETLAICPHHAQHFTLAERPLTLNLEKKCYMPPFILHGYYAKYLRPWMSAYGPTIVHSGGKSSVRVRDRITQGSSGGGHLLILDFGDLKENPGTVMNTVSSFLHLAPFNFDTDLAFNTRDNRGVHQGSISGIKKSALGKGSLDEWTQSLLQESSQSPKPDTAKNAPSTPLRSSEKRQIDWESISALRHYFKLPDAELRALLHGRYMSWM